MFATVIIIIIINIAIIIYIIHLSYFMDDKTKAQITDSRTCSGSHSQ